MQVNTDLVKPGSNSATQSDSTASELRRRGWLLHLEQAMLERRDRNRDTDISNNGGASVKYGECFAGAEMAHDASTLSVLNRGHIPVAPKSIHSVERTEQMATGDAGKCLPARDKPVFASNLNGGLDEPLQNDRALASIPAGVAAVVSAGSGTIGSATRGKGANIVAADRLINNISRLEPPIVAMSGRMVQVQQTGDPSKEVLASSRRFNGADGSRNVDLGNAYPAHEYARRMIHLYYDGDSVQAWIRDAELALPDMVTISHLLNHELKQIGQKIAHVTVNGRTVVRADDGHWSALGEAALDDAHTDSHKLQMEGQTI